MDPVSIAATLPTFFDPLQQLVVHGVEFSKEVRLDKRWASIRQAAHVLSGEFALPGWNVRSSITYGPYICDIRASDFDQETLCVLLSASKFNEIQHGGSAWFPLVSPMHHAQTAPLRDMDDETSERCDMLQWMRTILRAPRTFWSRGRCIDTKPIVQKLLAYLHGNLESKKEVYLGTDAQVSALLPIAVVSRTAYWNDFLDDYITIASSDEPEPMVSFLRNIPSSLKNCPTSTSDLIKRPIVNNEEDLCALLITLIVVYENIMTKREIYRYTGENVCFDKGPARSFVHWWSDYAWRRFDTYHGREYGLLPEPKLLDYFRDWKGTLQITKYLSVKRGKLAHSIFSQRHCLQNSINAMDVKFRDRVKIMRNTSEGRRRFVDLQKSTLYDWCMSLKVTEDFITVPLRIDRAKYDSKMMEIARRGLGDDFTTARSVRADIVPAILSSKPWVKDGVMSKIQGRHPVKLLCGGDVIKTEPISKTLFIYQVSSTWTKNEYPRSRQPLQMWVDGYRTRALALLVFELAICGITTKQGYEELIDEFEQGIDLRGLYREGRLQRILNNVPIDRKWSDVRATVNSFNLSIAMEASVTRELIDLCMRSGHSQVFTADEYSVRGGYLKLYGVAPGEGIMKFDSMVNLAGLRYNDDEKTPFFIGPSGKWYVSFYDVGGASHAHLHGKIEWRYPYSHMTAVTSSMWMATNKEITLSYPVEENAAFSKPCIHFAVEKARSRRGLALQ